MSSTQPRTRVRRRTALLILGIVLAAVVAFALTQLNLHRVGHALVSATPGWLVLALALMMLSMVFRAISWHEVLRAALPTTRLPWPAVIRATMIGVMTSAVFPGRLGEPTRVVVLSRRLEGSTRRLLAVIAGTVFSQTLINLLALAILAAVTFGSVQLLHGHTLGILAFAALPLAVIALVLGGPALLRQGRRSRSLRVKAAALAVAQGLAQARRGLVVFAKPRHGLPAIAAQLFAWALQWTSCYAVLLALGLQSHASPALAAAATVLLAVNVSAVLPATPSNVGVFQAACLVVLAAYGVGAGPALAYGIILQAVEVVTALALGVPALFGEGMSWSDIRSTARESSADQGDEREQQVTQRESATR